MATYKIGTRGSLLAVTQSTLVKHALEKLSGESFELVTIKTQGDEVTNKPLWQLEGKDFFTKELDEALLKGDVDFVIHSYKDLGSVRPEGIKLAAVTERRFAHDILLIPQKNVDSLRTWTGDFVVGTSSPRRIVNLTRSLRKYLPYGEERALSLKCETLRGNINSRVRKLQEGQYHAITLALAGLERLAHTEKSATELRELLKGLNYFILPQSVFPSAASQGALGIEMRADRDDQGKLAHLLAKLAHPETVEEVYRERKAFKDYGGGCHLAVGIHVKKIGEQFLHVHRGQVDEKIIDQKWIEGALYPKLPKGKKLFIGLPQGNQKHCLYDEYLEKKTWTSAIDLADKHVFVTSRYCVPTLKASGSPAGIWAAGTKTAELLAKEGYWINGTSDSLGTDDLKALKSSRMLQMFNDIGSNWIVLSHKDASSDIGSVVGCYERREKAVDPLYEESLKNVGACYWTSFPQYQAFMKRFPFLGDAHHYCGLGKTWQEFKSHGKHITPLASMQDFTHLVQE